MATGMERSYEESGSARLKPIASHGPKEQLKSAAQILHLLDQRIDPLIVERSYGESGSARLKPIASHVPKEDPARNLSRDPYTTPCLNPTLPLP